ncbi:MAG: putative cytochrome family protein, partial [Tardiphaga sp.]|nr:putative cytochrome family protein [Tardiphaga sp.]
MSMQSVSPATHILTRPRPGALAHIPGDEGWPIVGRTFEVLANPRG